MRPEESELWAQVAKSIRRLHTAETQIALPEVPASPSVVARDPKPPEAGWLKIASPSVQPTKPQPAAYTALGGRSANALRMDAKTHAAMTRGKLVPEARLDLHGKTIAEAHEALQSFILRAYTQNKRLVLVITGKGRSSRNEPLVPTGLGVLRHHVPHWLTAPPLSHCVLQLSQSHSRHGGEGAYYVYLRRARPPTAQ